MALAILENLGAKVVGIPMTEGMNLELLEQYAAIAKIALYDWYLAQSYGANDNMPIANSCSSGTVQCQFLEDNAYEGLNFEPVPLPSKL